MRVGRPPDQRMLWPRWILANTLALGLGIAAIRLALPTFSGDEFLAGRPTETLLLLLVTAAPVTLTLGAAQAWAVRPALGGRRWLWLTVAGTYLGWPLGATLGVIVALLVNAMLAAQGATLDGLPLAAVRNGIAALIGAVIGATQGAFQARVLTGRPAQRVWTAASALSGGLGFALMLALLLGLDPAVQGAGSGPRLAAAFAAGAVGGAFGSAASGLALRSHLRLSP